MRNPIFDILSAVKPLVIILAVILLLAITATSMKAQCPIKDNALKDSHVVSTTYDNGKFERVYSNQVYGLIRIVMYDVDNNQYRIHKNSNTVPTSPRNHQVKVYWSGKLQIFSVLDILKSLNII